MTIGQWVKTLLDTIRKGSEEGGNYFGTFWFKFGDFWLKWLVMIFKYINKYAYITCAVHGTNFFESASQAFNLIMRNIHFAFVSSWVNKALT